MQMKRTSRMAALASGALLIAASPLSAAPQDAPPPRAPASERSLREKGRHASAHAPAPDTALATGEQPGEAPPQGQVQLGDLSVDLGGYGSFRYELNEADGVANSITLRRFVLTTDARVRDRLQVYFELEFERLSEIEIERSAKPEAGGIEFEQELEGSNASEIAVEQAWAQFNFSPAFGLRFGAVLPPVGRFNLLHDDNLWDFPRRPLIVRGANVLPAKAAWTEMSLGFVGQANVGEQVALSYQAYLLNGVGLDFAIEEKVQTRVPKRNKLELEAVVSPQQGSFDGENTANAVAGRLQVSPALGSEYAVSGYFGEYTPSFLEVTENLSTIGFDMLQRIGPLQLEGEFLYSHYAGLESVFADIARVAVDQATETESEETAELESEIEIETKGLSENRYGFWLDAKLPLAIKRGFLGLENPVLIPVVRYERVWFDDNLDELSFSGGSVTGIERSDREQERLSLGFAFRPVPQAVLHFVYERNADLEGALLDPAISDDETNAFTFGMAFGF